MGAGVSPIVGVSYLWVHETPFGFLVQVYPRRPHLQLPETAEKPLHDGLMRHFLTRFVVHVWGVKPPQFRVF